MKTNEPYPIELCPELMAVIRALEPCNTCFNDGFDDWIYFGANNKQGFRINNNAVTDIKDDTEYYHHIDNSCSFDENAKSEWRQRK